MLEVQLNDRYAGRVIGGHYQVLASCVGESFYVVDLTKDDLLIREQGRGSDILRFASVHEAETFVYSTLVEGNPYVKKEHIKVAREFPSRKVAPAPVVVEEPKKRHRRTKAEMEAARAAEREALNDEYVRQAGNSVYTTPVVSMSKVKTPTPVSAPVKNRAMDVVGKAAALSLLREIVINRCPTPTITAFLTFSLDVIESLGA